MGIMNKLNKMKNFLFDEEEVEEKPVKKKKYKKVVKNKEINSNNFDDDFDKTQEIENLYLEDLSEPEPAVKQEVRSRVVKNEPEFKFPEFDDDDFAVTKTKVEPISPVVKQEAKPVLYQGSKRKEEAKKFKPSPIISPVYGLLDSEGTRVKKTSDESDKISRNKDDISFDEVRKKAYGKVDEEIEDTLKKLNKKTIEEAEKELEKSEIELSRTKEKAKKKTKEEKKVTVLENDSSDDMILPNVNFREIDVDKEREENSKNITKKDISSYDDDDDDTKEQDLFNLIDTMYQGEEKED